MGQSEYAVGMNGAWCVGSQPLRHRALSYVDRVPLVATLHSRRDAILRAYTTFPPGVCMRFIFARLFAVVFSRLFVTRRRGGGTTPRITFPQTLYFAHVVGWCPSACLNCGFVFRPEGRRS